MTKHIWRGIACGVFFGVLPLLIGRKFDIAGVSLNGPAAYAAAAATGVSVTLIARFSIRRSVRD